MAKASRKHSASTNVIDFNRAQESTLRKKVTLLPRSVNQETFIDHLLDQSSDIVCVHGSAGGGKTYLATLAAIKMFSDQLYKKIVIARPITGIQGEEMGFLPGTATQKLEPVLLPILDVFHEHFSRTEVKNMLNDGRLEVCPIAFIRGRTFKNAVVIIDEAQNLSVDAMKSILTRIGEDSKLIITGDTKQSDRRDTSGLSDFINRLGGHQSNRIKVVEFTRKDIQRHPVVSEVLGLYGE